MTFIRGKNMTEKDIFKKECGCYTPKCRLSVKMPIHEGVGINRRGLILFVKGCNTKPVPTYQLIKKTENYSLYQF